MNVTAVCCITSLELVETVSLGYGQDLSASALTHVAWGLRPPPVRHDPPQYQLMLAQEAELRVAGEAS